MGLRSYIVTRILLMIPMLIFLMTIVFLIVRVLPGDPFCFTSKRMYPLQPSRK